MQHLTHGKMFGIHKKMMVVAFPNSRRSASTVQDCEKNRLDLHRDHEHMKGNVLNILGNRV
jgi:hypothetical protein